MRGASRITSIASVAMLTAGLATAEVRLVENPGDGSLSVEIASTPRGPWTPTGGLTDRILNPSGDLFGDGMPGWDSRGRSVLSAWIRPGSGILHRSLGGDPGWNPLDAIASPGAQGQPVVDDLTDGWSVTWQQADPAGPKVLVTGTNVIGQAVDPIVASTGLLVGTSPAGNLLNIVTMESNGQLWCTTVSFSFIPTQPIPIQLVVLGRVRLGRSGAAGFGLPQPGNGYGRGGTEASLPPVIHDVLRSDGAAVGVLTWTDERGDVKSVELGPDGPRLPGHSQGLKPGRVREDASSVELDAPETGEIALTH